jgi:hypothetical protein
VRGLANTPPFREVGVGDQRFQQRKHNASTLNVGADASIYFGRLVVGVTLRYVPLGSIKSSAAAGSHEEVHPVRFPVTAGVRYRCQNEFGGS